MCALTLLFSPAASFALLHASSLHSGYTSEANAIQFPSGDQTGPLPPVESFVTCSLSSPSGSITQIWPPVTYAIFFPSGDQRGWLDELPPLVSCFGSPPPMGTT